MQCLPSKMLSLKSSCDTRMWGMPVPQLHEGGSPSLPHSQHQAPRLLHCNCSLHACWVHLERTCPSAYSGSSVLSVTSERQSQCQKVKVKKSQCLLASFTILVLKNTHYVLKNKCSSMKWLNSIKLPQSASEMFNQLFEVT